MQLIGFNFTKISAENPLIAGKKTISTKIDFTNVEEKEMTILKDAKTASISFNYLINYEDKENNEETKGSISFEGKILFSVSDDEHSLITEAWKEKQIPETMRVPLFNIILQKCTPKAVFLQDEINLPPHMPMPRVGVKKEENDQQKS